MLSKHFAVLGSTGVGKSTSVSLLLNEILQARPNLRVFLLDVHNEYGRCFGDRALVLNPRNLKLPFWLFNFEEIVDVLFGGRPGVPEELDVLAEIIPMAKGIYTQYQNSDRIGLKRMDPKSGGYTVDTPVPYRLVDLISLIDERMGKLENRSSRIIYHKLISRIETVRNDPRYTFMFDNANVGGDTMAEVISHLFRLPANGRPMTIMQLAGFPAEVVNSVVSVLCRMAFDFGLWSDGVSPLLFVCEEAHRYAAADRNIGFGPTRKAVSRIAKEGRKYGVFLGLVTQRPAELDATIISQCNTLFAMRLANDRDQALLRSAVSDAAANLLSFVPSLGTREVLAFGEGVALPTRLRFKEVPVHQLPRSEATIATAPSVTAGHDMHFVSRRAGPLARRHLASRRAQRSRHHTTGPPRAHDAGGSADAAAVDGARSRSLLAAEEAAALRALAFAHFLRVNRYPLRSKALYGSGTAASRGREPGRSLHDASLLAKRFPTPALDKLPDDIRTRILAVQEKSGFVPNVFLTLAYRPDEFRAFFAYHDALMEKDSGLTKAEREMIVVATSQRQPVPLLRDRAWRDPAHPGEESADRRPDRRQLPQGGHHAAAARHARLRHEGEPRGQRGIGGGFCRGRRPRLYRRRHLGHHRDLRLLCVVEPVGQRHRDASQRRILHDGTAAEIGRSHLARKRSNRRSPVRTSRADRPRPCLSQTPGLSPSPWRNCPPRSCAAASSAKNPPTGIR